MDKKNYQIGMIGLGVMGRNLVLNMSDHGYSVAGYDKNSEMVQRLNEEAKKRPVEGFDDLGQFVKSLQKPRSVMILVPAGKPVDAVIKELLSELDKGDLIIDGGNSHFSDTNLRAKSLAEKGIHYLGVGISGGESGARHGPSMMPGGAEEAYERVRPIFEAAAAHVDGESCVTFLGPGSAGHYVKMVHNGIEYGIMQLISEIYDLMKRGLGMTDDEIHQVFVNWNKQELNSYLVEITGAIFNEIDEQIGRPLIDVILDEAKQKGTGMWTSQDAMDLQVPTPTIDLAVAMRNLSAMKDERQRASRLLAGKVKQYEGEKDAFIMYLRNALYAGMIICYAQGFAQLHVASREYGYHLVLEDVARIWRGGCIIRSALLEQICSAFKRDHELPNLLLDSSLGSQVMERKNDLQTVISSAVQLDIPTPGLMVSLAYLNGYRSAWLPANLIQAQRDYFGAHTYERIDEKGVFHTKWEIE